MDKLWEQNKWDNSTMVEWAATHTRTSSKQWKSFLIAMLF
jgi:hypothetical protein